LPALRAEIEANGYEPIPETSHKENMNARCSFCSGQPHTMAECPACGSREELQAEIKRLVSAIVETLKENRHLADGDNCTLAKLKRAVNWTGL
jgi:hypothetical protein